MKNIPFNKKYSVTEDGIVINNKKRVEYRVLPVN
jgi:hypothetical protein